jgi:CelD/BcsL family acetyltransferase involved in cellulose biosynthesis
MGSLRLGLIYVGQAPVAAQLWLMSGSKAVIYKLAYDEAYEAYSVGSILTRELASFVLSHDHPDELDYGVGSEPYKKDWMDGSRRLIGIEANNWRTFAGTVHAIEQRARSGLKRTLVRN